MIHQQPNYTVQELLGMCIYHILVYRCDIYVYISYMLIHSIYICLLFSSTGPKISQNLRLHPFSTVPAARWNQPRLKRQKMELGSVHRSWLGYTPVGWVKKPPKFEHFREKWSQHGGPFQIFLEFSPRKLGKISNLTNIFQIGWNHQLENDGEKDYFSFGIA